MKYIIEKKKDKVFSFLLDDAGHAVEIHVDDPADGPKIGDIYIGIVQKVLSLFGYVRKGKLAQSEICVIPNYILGCPGSQSHI